MITNSIITALFITISIPTFICCCVGASILIKLNAKEMKVYYVKKSKV